MRAKNKPASEKYLPAVCRNNCLTVVEHQIPNLLRLTFPPLHLPQKVEHKPDLQRAQKTNYCKAELKAILKTSCRHNSTTLQSSRGDAEQEPGPFPASWTHSALGKPTLNINCTRVSQNLQASLCLPGTGLTTDKHRATSKSTSQILWLFPQSDRQKETK